MDARARSDTRQLHYQDFVPSHKIVKDEESETLLLELPGFVKEQIEIQLDDQGKMSIGGQRPVEGNTWSRFHKEHQIAENCNFDEITVKIEDGVLNITLPKLAIDSGQSQKSTATASAVAAKATPERKPSGGSDEDDTLRRNIPSSSAESCNGSVRKQQGREKISSQAAAARQGKEEEDNGTTETGRTTVAGGSWKREGERGGRTRLFRLQYWRPWFVIAASLAAGLGFYMTYDYVLKKYMYFLR